MTLAIPQAARRVRDGLLGAVSAATSRDREAFVRSVGELLSLDPGQTGSVLHEVVLRLLERAHPDGLDGDDVRALLEQVVADSAGWLPRLDPTAFALVLGGALSVHEDDEPRADFRALVAAAAVVVSHLLVILEATLPPVIDEAFRELHRAQTMELP